MAPRGRRRTVGLSRKDAARDAMLAMDFPRRLITQTIDELLKVYGGIEGWRFIEMDSHQVLIEALLEKTGQEAGCLQDGDIGENSQRFSEAGSSSVPPPPVDEEVPAPLPPADDGLDSESQTETVVNPPIAITESECNMLTSPAEEREEDDVAGLLEPVSNSVAPCLDEECNAITSPAEEREEGDAAGLLEPVANLNNSVAPCLDEDHAPIPSLAGCNSFTPPAEENQVAGPTNPVSSPVTPCSDEQPARVLSSMYNKRRRRPPCHGFVRKKDGYYTEPTSFVELESSGYPEELLKLMGRDIPRSRNSMWDVASKS